MSSRRIVGLEFTADCLKAVYLQGRFPQLTLQNCWQEPILVSEEKNWEAAASAALKNLRKRFPKTGYQLVTALGREEILLQPLTYSFADLNKISQVARFDVEPYLPLPLEQVLLDYYVISIQNGTTEIMMAGALRHSVEQKLALLENAGLPAPAVGFTALALINAVVGMMPAESDFLLLDVGIEESTLSLAQAKKLHSSRCLTFGQTELRTENLAPLLREINLSLQSWGVRRLAGAAPKLYLTGRSGFPPAFADKLAAALNLEVSVLHLAAHLKSARPLTLTADFNTALALAWTGGGVNFLKEKQQAAQNKSRLREILLSAGVIGSLIILLAGVDLYFRVKASEKHAARVNANIAQQFQLVSPQTKRVVQPTQQLTVMFKKLEQKNALLHKLLSGRSSGLNVLRDLSAIIPWELQVQFHDFLLEKDTLQLGGETLGFEEVEKLKEVLATSPKFANIAILESSSPPGANGVKFKMRLKVVEK